VSTRKKKLFYEKKKTQQTVAFGEASAGIPLNVVELNGF
jgi:hypothetical protein